MVSREQLDDVFKEEGAALHTYLQNKNRGGAGNSKGNTFENLFAVYNIAKLFNSKPRENDNGTFFTSQAKCFVDDLVIKLDKDQTIQHYQLKDVANLSWTNGNHTIENDFIYQKKLCDSYNITSELALVVSSRGLALRLEANIPATIIDFTKVIIFPTATSVNNLIKTNGLLKDELTNMCAISNPAADKLEALCTILLGVWDSTDKQEITLTNLLNKCYEINPNYIKGLINQVSADLANIFGSIKGFTYKIENGFIEWQYNNTDDGIISYRIGSAGFIQWENDIKQSGKIKSFEDLEPFLI